MRLPSCLSPDSFGRFGEDPQLPLFILYGNSVSHDGCGKPALRGDRQPFQRHKPGGFIYAPLERFEGFQTGAFCGDETEDDRFIVRNVP